jgi:hypothetical protein
VLLVSSRYPLVCVTLLSFGRKGLHSKGSSFSRSYGCNLPSSLTMVLPIALVFSTRPPVSVWGTGAISTHCWAFLGSIGSVTSSIRLGITSQDKRPNSHRTSLHAYPETTIAPVHLPSCVPLQLPSAGSENSPCGSLFSTNSGLGADMAVLEYQPVVHRLRLSASP